MKKILFLLTILFTFWSCSTEQELYLFLIVNEVTDHEAELSWRVSGNDGPVVFEIKLDDQVLEPAYEGSYYLVRDLDDSSSYTITVTARDAGGHTSTDSFSITTLEDTVFEGPFELDTQEEYDNFDLTRVVGALIIRNLDIPDLSNLSTLEAIGSLYIENCTINSLNGLQNITEFITGTGSVTLINNPNLSDLTAISALEGSMGALTLDNNPSLQDLAGLGLADNAQLVVRNSPNANFNDLPMSSSFRGIRLINLPNLNDISQFSGRNVTGFLELENIPQLSSLQGFGLVTQLTTRLRLSNLPSLNDLTGLQNLTSVGMDESIDPAGRSVELKFLNITNLSGLNGLTEINRLVINECDSMTNLNGTSLSGSVPSGMRLFITRNDVLTNFCGLTELANNVQFQDYQVTGNAYNPNVNQIRSTTECSQ